MPENKPDFDPDLIFERRRFVRIDGSFVVNYTDVSTAEPKSDISQTKNISLGGLMFTTDKAFTPGTTLKLKLRLPHSLDYINVKVQVVGSKQRLKHTLCETRARFIGIREEDKDYIRKIVEYNTQKGK